MYLWIPWFGSILFYSLLSIPQIVTEYTLGMRDAAQQRKQSEASEVNNVER